MTNRLKEFISKHQNKLDIYALQELEEINKEYNYLHTSFENSPCTISLLNSDGIYLNANKAMLDLVKLNKSDFIGTKLGDLTKDTVILKLINQLKDTHTEQSSIVIDSSFNNIKRVFLITVNKVGDNFLTVGVDITQVKELQEENKFNEKMATLGEISSFIVHEINNPLAAIKLSNELIGFINEDDFDSNPKLLEYVENINSMIEVTSNIIGSLKTLARKTSQTVKENDFMSILNKTKFILSGKLKEKNVKLLLDLPDDLSITADEGDILQVLINLISNAIDAVSDLEEKWIKVKLIDNKIIIQDSGHGIPEEFVSSLFKKFHTSKGDKGNGIGLYLSKDILNKWGFDLYYEKLENHTCFVIAKIKEKAVA